MFPEFKFSSLIHGEEYVTMELRNHFYSKMFFFFFCILTAFLPLVQCLDITQVYSIRSPWVDLGTSIYFQLIGSLDPLAQSMA